MAVVGAGLAGLRTAMLLEKAGFDVTVFEARDRVGGRLWTRGDDETGFYDAGGEWIDSDHTRIFALLEELGQSAEQDHQYPGEILLGSESFDEELLTPDIQAQLERFEITADELCLDLELPAWSNILSSDLDARSLESLIQSHFLDPKTEKILRASIMSDEGDEPSRVGLLGWLCNRLNYMERTGGEMSSYRFSHGAGGFCESMKSRLRGRVRFQHRLMRVTDDGPQLELEFESGLTEKFDFAILTLPPIPLQQIDFQPGISDEKRFAIDQMQMSRTLKVALHFDQKFWTAGVRLKTDSWLMQCWDGGREGANVVLCYPCGDRADTIRDTGQEALTQHLLQDLSRRYPDAAKHFVRIEVIDWVGDPFAGGGFPLIPPGYVLEHWESYVRPEGRVFFAGDATAQWCGFIEGALESAERVTEEVKFAANL